MSEAILLELDHISHMQGFIFWIETYTVDRKQMQWKPEYPKQQLLNELQSVFQLFTKFWPQHVSQYFKSSQKCWWWRSEMVSYFS